MTVEATTASGMSSPDTTSLPSSALASTPSLKVRPFESPLATESYEGVVGGRVGTPFGVGILQGVRESDSMVIVKLPFGTIFLPKTALRTDTLEMIREEMSKVSEIARSCLNEREYPRALVVIQRGVRMAPYIIQDNIEIRKTLSDLFTLEAASFLGLEQYENAAFAGDKAVKMDQKNAYALFRLGQAQSRLGNHPEAARLLKKAGRQCKKLNLGIEDIMAELASLAARDASALKAKRLFSDLRPSVDGVAGDSTLSPPPRGKVRRTTHGDDADDESAPESQHPPQSPPQLLSGLSCEVPLWAAGVAAVAGIAVGLVAARLLRL